MSDALVVLRNTRIREELTKLLDEASYRATGTASFVEARRRLRTGTVKLLFTELRLPDGDGRRLPRAGTTSVLVAGRDCARRSGALPEGFEGRIRLPLQPEAVRSLLSSICPPAADSDEREGDDTPPPRARLLGESPVMRSLVQRLECVAPSNAPVLITGETGSGKEVAARTIHALSRRSDRPFVAVNCGAISPSLMESQLFGHERGSFTGATRRHRGVFERAHGGTLFLDEITEMPVELQVKLLRALEGGEFHRTGGEESVSVDVRTVAATNREIEEVVEKGRLREDLYYRLKVLHVALPPLRDRIEDIPLLADAFLEEIAAAEEGTKTLAEDTLDALRRYSWPGNVRELRNAIYTAYLLSEGPIVTACSLPKEILREEGESPDLRSPVVRVPLGTSIREAERRLILSTLTQMNGNKTRTAETLGISPKTLYNRLHSYAKRAADPALRSDGLELSA